MKGLHILIICMAALVGAFLTTAQAQSAVCGDGIINYQEQCEDGNTANGDGCNSFCKLECGANEDCPNDVMVGICYSGIQTIVHQICTFGECGGSQPMCTTELGNCNNSVDDDSDDGTPGGGIDCSDPDCNADAVCGGTETACTDHLDNDFDGSTDCADSDCSGNPACGGGDACDAFCRKTYCGDGIVQSPNGDGILEECDGTALCSPGCRTVSAGICGNGIREGLEACDDGKRCSGNGDLCQFNNDCPSGQTCVGMNIDGCTTPGGVGGEPSTLVLTFTIAWGAETIGNLGDTMTHAGGNTYTYNDLTNIGDPYTVTVNLAKLSGDTTIEVVVQSSNYGTITSYATTNAWPGGRWTSNPFTNPDFPDYVISDSWLDAFE